MRIVLKSEILRAWVTGANPDYVGSVIIDSALMKRADMEEYEKVLVCNRTNGQLWETYALPGEWGLGTVSVQGAGALLCEEGDCLDILCFDATDDPVNPKTIVVDRCNKFVKSLEEGKHDQPVL